MVEFVSRYENFVGLEYDSRVTGHGAIYGSSSCGKSTLVRNLCLNGMFKHCKTVVFLNGKTSALPSGFEKTMKQRWGTLVYSYRIANESELISKINEIEDSFLLHRQHEYAKVGESTPDEIDLRSNMGFGNLKIIIDDLHKEVVKSDTLARKFQAIRHSGIELLFVTQSFKNTNMHDLIKENLSYVILFKLSQNKVTVKSYLSDLSMSSSSVRSKQEYRSTLEYIYSRMVQRNDSILTFPEEDTCYLYICMPKRSCKRVSDVRTSISNPNRQICFQEIDCNSCKILFAERSTKLKYENRFERVPMRVLSEKEQVKRLNNENDNDNDNRRFIDTINTKREEDEQEYEEEEEEEEEEEREGSTHSTKRPANTHHPKNRKNLFETRGDLNNRKTTIQRKHSKRTIPEV